MVYATSANSNEYVGNVGDVCHVGDTMRVKVIAVDEQDRVKSRRAVMEDCRCG